jgi:hypothetical protein
MAKIVEALKKKSRLNCFTALLWFARTFADFEISDIAALPLDSN